MAVSAAEWDRRIAAGLKGCTDEARRYFDAMRDEFEQLLSTVTGSAAGSLTVIPPESLAQIAQRTRVGTERSLAELHGPRRGLLEVRTTGVHLPLVAKAHFARIHEAAKSRNSYHRRKGVRGGEKGVRRGENPNPTHLPPENTGENTVSGGETGGETPDAALPPAASPALSLSPASPFPNPTPNTTPQPGPSGGGLFGDVAAEVPRPGRAAKPKPDPAAIPASLDTPEFRAVWADWQRHRREIGQTLTPTTVRLQFAKLERFGPAGAVASIVQSIENGWTGLFEPRNERKPANGHHHPQHKPASQPAAPRRVGEFPQRIGIPRLGPKAGHG